MCIDQGFITVNLFHFTFHPIFMSLAYHRTSSPPLSSLPPWFFQSALFLEGQGVSSMVQVSPRSPFTPRLPSGLDITFHIACLPLPTQHFRLARALHRTWNIYCCAQVSWTKPTGSSPMLSLCGHCLSGAAHHPPSASSLPSDKGHEGYRADPGTLSDVQNQNKFGSAFLQWG